MIRRNVDLIAIAFLLLFMLTGSAARHLPSPRVVHIEQMRPRVMEIRREVLEAREEVRHAVREATTVIKRLPRH